MNRIISSIILLAFVFTGLPAYGLQRQLVSNKQSANKFEQGQWTKEAGSITQIQILRMQASLAGTGSFGQGDRPQAIFDRFKERTSLKGKRFLELGCGIGTVAMQAQREVGENGFVIGLDANEDAIELAREVARYYYIIEQGKKVQSTLDIYSDLILLVGEKEEGKDIEINIPSNIDFICADAAQLPFEADSFDIINAAYMLDPFDASMYTIKVIFEILRVAAEGSYIQIDPCNEEAFNKVIQAFRRVKGIDINCEIVFGVYSVFAHVISKTKAPARPAPPVSMEEVNVGGIQSCI